jgi:hypothetical protein
MAYSWCARTRMCMCVCAKRACIERRSTRQALTYTLLQQRCDGWMEHDTVGPDVGRIYTHVHVAPGIAGMSMYYKSAEECRY